MNRQYPTMPIQNYNRAISRAFQMFTEKDKYVYLYGCKGVLLTSEKQIWDIINRNEDGHFNKYSDVEKEEIVRNSLGKIGFDCSGFVLACYDWLKDAYSSLLYAQRRKEYAADDARIGNMIYQQTSTGGRHIMMYVAKGYLMDMGRESTEKNIELGLAGIRLRPISQLTLSDCHFFSHKDVDMSYTSTNTISKEYM